MIIDLAWQMEITSNLINIIRLTNFPLDGKERRKSKGRTR